MRNHWFNQIQCLLCQKSTDLSEQIAEIWKKVARIWKNKKKKRSEFGKNGQILNRLLFGLGFTGFEIKNRQPTHWGRVSEVGTHIRPPESSDRMAASWMPFGQTGWAGCPFPWTPTRHSQAQLTRN